jgi:hypothetical protein
METSPSDRQQVYASLPGGRRDIVAKTGLPSYSIPALFRWLKRHGLAGNEKKGYWEPVSIPAGVSLYWQHGLFHLGACPSCMNRNRPHNG